MNRLFCGGSGAIEHEFNEAVGGENWVKVQCKTCGANTGFYLSEERAITAWNNRA